MCNQDAAITTAEGVMFFFCPPRAIPGQGSINLGSRENLSHLKAELQLLQGQLEAAADGLDSPAEPEALALPDQPATAVLLPLLGSCHHSLHLCAGRGLHQQLPPADRDSQHL